MNKPSNPITTNSSNEELTGHEVAIVGMACRVPGARDINQYWENLASAKESLTTLSDTELRKAGVSTTQSGDPNYVKAGMFLEDMELFDSGFFGFSVLDGRIMDPQHRQFLEVCWEAFEDACVDPAVYKGSVGVFAGSGHNAYLHYNVLGNKDLENDVGFFLLRHTGNDKDFLTTRASYCFNLTGPSVNIQTACSTSLVAVHSAAQSLLNGECDMALAGGVTINLPARCGYTFKENEILSPDGHCKPFEAASAGTVFGSGAGVVLLKRLDDALQDGNIIHAVIKATAINNDGANKVSYLAPSVDGQAAAMQEALELAEVDPASIGFIECHGTGTAMGDPIEVAALQDAYGVGGVQESQCAIGSVKSNIGHLDTAAGVASLIKAVLSLKHRKLVPTLHYANPNPAIDFGNSRFYVNAELNDWHAAGPRRAAVNSLGVGGTNAHIVLEEAPREAQSDAGRDWQLLLLSARSEQSLQRATVKLSECLSEPGVEKTIADVGYTLAIGRHNFSRRRFAVVSSVGEAVKVFDAMDPERLPIAKAAEQPRKVVFMFAGGGAQYAGMGQGLYTSESKYRSAVDECLELLAEMVDCDMRALLYPSLAASGEALDEAKANEELQRPSRTLPALFITQYAQAKLWISWGIEPAGFIGHSVGENTAACLAGVMSLKDALGLVVLRGQLFEQVPEGGMLSVELGADDVEKTAKEAGVEGLSIAAINAPGLTVVSGPKSALLAIEKHLAEKGVGYKRVAINIAAHSSMLEPILPAFGDYLRSIKLNEPELPFISNRTGAWITKQQATSPDYWVEHLRYTVRFADGVGVLLEKNQYHLLEVGPGRTLSSLASMHSSKTAGQTILASLRHPDEATADLPFMLDTLGKLWQGNTDIDWTQFYAGQKRHFTALPSYQFDHARCWVDPPAAVPDAKLRADKLEDFLYQPVWHRQASLQCPSSLQGACVLLLRGQADVAEALGARLVNLGANVVEVRLGESLCAIPGQFTVRAGESDDFVHILDAICKSGDSITHTVYALGLELTAQTTLANVASGQLLAFDSLFNFAQALGNEDLEQNVKLLILTAGAQQVAGELTGPALQGVIHSAARVIDNEIGFLATVVCDLPGDYHNRDIAYKNYLEEQLVAELVRPCGVVVDDIDTVGNLVALRGFNRFTLSHQLVPPQAAAEPVDSLAPTIDHSWSSMPLRAGGKYLVTGGLGGLGLRAAEALARREKIHLLLLARRKLPERQYWQALIDQSAAEAVMLEQLLLLESLAISIEVYCADVTDKDSLVMLAKQHGPVHGILHTAGTVDDSLIQLKELSSAHKVLAPKVQGTLALAEVFELKKLDFLVVYSSTSAYCGIPGQIDYAAANGFLDAFAAAASARGESVISINWPAWREVGMAAAIADGSAARTQPPGRPVDHPLLDRCIEETEARIVFSTLFSVDKFWLLGEHRIKDGGALIPGSGFMELARAAYAERFAGSQVEFIDVHFDLPFFVADHEYKEMQIALETQEGQPTKFILSSLLDGDLIEHAVGFMQKCSGAATVLDITELRERCKLSRQYFDDPDQHPLLEFGERWTVYQHADFGSGEALVTLAMPDRYATELDDYCLHPALLDMATAGAQKLIEGYQPQDELYVPVSYGSLCFYGNLLPAMTSHIVLKHAGVNSQSQAIAVFDITLISEAGQVLLKIVDFTMQRISDIHALRSAVNNHTAAENTALNRTLELGIDPGEGTEALCHILEQGMSPRVMVGAVEPGFLCAELIKPYQLNETKVVEPSHDPDSDPEIDEIQNALQSNEAIEALAVRSFIDSAGGRRLIAYFVADWDHHITVSELRSFAKSVLPETSLPQHFVELDELPVESDGKINLLALEDPFALKDTYVAPKTSTQRGLAKIWQDVLGVEKIGLGDNFFDAGGHSLLSIRAIMKLDKKFGVRLDQATMVLHTLEQVAREIDEQLPEVAANDLSVSTESKNADSSAVAGKGEDSGSNQPAGGLGKLKSLFGKSK